MGNIRKFASVLSIVAMMSSIIPLQAFAAIGDNLENADASYDVNDVLSSEYILDDGSRFSIVAYDDTDTTDEENSSEAGGFFYFKGDPYSLDTAFTGTIDNETLDFTGTWQDAYGSTGSMTINFEVAEADGGAYEVLCTANIGGSTYACAETARAKYVKNEVEEITQELAVYITSGEEFDPKNPIPPLNQIVSTEFINNEGWRMVFLAADDEMLASYGIDAEYNTVGLIYERSNVAVMDSVMFGNMVTDEENGRVSFDGYWTNGSIGENMYINFIVKTKTDAEGDGFYVVAGYGTWYDYADDGLQCSGSVCDDALFITTETLRSKHAKHELNEFENDLAEYVEEEDVADEVEDEAGDTTGEELEDDEAVDEEDLEEIEDSIDEEGCNPFTDVSSSYEYCESVEYVKEEGIVSGYPDNTYKPTNTVNRAEFAKIIIGATHTEEEMTQCLKDNLGDSFTDVPRNVWFAKYVCVAKAEGIISGYADKTFQPSRQIALSEAAKIMSLAFELEVAASSDPWYKMYIDALAEENAIPLSFDTADQAVERGEMAEMIQRLHAPDSSKESETYASLTGSGSTKDGQEMTEEEEEEEVNDEEEEEDEDEDEIDSNTEYLFYADLSGTNEVPSVDSDFMGTLTLRLVGDYVDYNLILNDPSGVLVDMTDEEINDYFTGAHFHMGEAGENGDVRHTLPDDLEYDGVSSYEIVGSWEDLDSEEIEMLFDGEIYVNLHTVDNPSGEIRGQVILEENE